ncbi:MAG: ribosome biogenesis GTP-binding protein YihA/YsxC [Candidatus Tenebribacter davisii]|jgi:GTP-binding protein|nr:ribosome biogenesis GTP-binding protein YihA/YsxC [Candidatus Tenebribacter davisii]
MRIVESKFVKSAVKPKDYYPTSFAEIAFAGKSNVGKSTLINTILNRKGIAKVSNKPGKTRLINFFEIRFKIDKKEQEGFFSFVDLPGYGYAKVSKTQRDSWKKMILTFFENRQQLRGVVCLVDIRHKADPKDILMIDMIQSMQIPFVVAATKSDKIPKSKVNSIIIKLKNELHLEEKQIFACSSLKKRGIDNILNWITDRVIDSNQ